MMKFSISRIKLFKACRRAWELRYLEGLRPVEKSEALEIGSNYHELLEHLYSEGSFDGVQEEYSKEQAMAVAYKKYIYPHFKVKAVEEWHERMVDGFIVCGRIDGRATDGCIVEHKTTSQEITEAYEYSLMWDEQILMYMLLTGARKVYYTVCRKPTIRQKKGESDEEFFNRMVEWYDTDTHAKIRLLVIERTDEEVEAFKEELAVVLNEIWSCILTQTKTGRFYRNTAYCQKWGRMCEYASVCLHYDPDQEYIEYTKEDVEI